MRMVRNEIIHPKGLNLRCTEEDLILLKDFHRRVLNVQDPLALAGKMQREEALFRKKNEKVQVISNVNSGAEVNDRKFIGKLLLAVIVAAFFVLAFFILIFSLILL